MMRNFYSRPLRATAGITTCGGRTAGGATRGRRRLLMCEQQPLAASRAMLSLAHRFWSSEPVRIMSPSCRGEVSR